MGDAAAAGGGGAPAEGAAGAAGAAGTAAAGAEAPWGGREGAYVPRCVLVTGAAGFIGSHFAVRMCQSYPSVKVVVLDKLDYCASMRNLDACAALPNFKFVQGDICSPDLVRFLLRNEGIDTIIHFAAQSHVDNSFGNSMEFTHANIYGTHVLLEASRAAGDAVRRFVHVSTDEVYGENELYDCEDDAKHEDATLEPTNPYAASKAAAEMLVKAYRRSYGLPVIVTRCNNVFGPGQYPEKLIPKVVLLAKRGAKLPIHGDGSAKRSYLYVEDVAEAYDAVLHMGKLGETYNIGTQHEVTVVDVVRMICGVMGVDFDAQVSHVADRPFNDQRYYLNARKLEKLGWTQRTSWEEGMRKTIEWYTRDEVSDGGYWESLEDALKAHPTEPAEETAAAKRMRLGD